MPSASEHFSQAQRNEGLFEEIGVSFSDWAMTALFYAAMHHVQAAFVQKGVSPIPTEHGSRKRAIKEHFQRVAGRYEDLEQWSRDARYECSTFSRGELEAAMNDLRAIRQALPNPALYD